MKILLISLFHPELVRGGAQQVAYELFCGLRSRGNDVTLLCSIDESVPALFKSGARITGFDGRDNEFLFLTHGYDHWWHKLSSPLLAASFAEFLETVAPDVIHFHHFLTFGVDFLTLAKRTCPEARILLTLHEFVAICHANGQLVRRVDKSLCHQASPVRCHQCFPEHTPERFFMRKAWLQSHLNIVDRFTTPSFYMKEFYVNWGLAENKITHIPNGQLNYAAGRVNHHADVKRKRNRFGFFGQLVDNKGILIILEAVNHLRNEGCTDFIVEINGDNLRYASAEHRKQIDSFFETEAEKDLRDRNVFLNGSYHLDSIAARMDRIDWCVVPSIWWETFALVISESWMFGKPVIASNIGAMSERVQDGIGGLIFNVADARDLARVIRRACDEEGLWSRLVETLPDPPDRETMVSGFLRLYTDTPALVEQP